jgi:hypothetical protein
MPPKTSAKKGSAKAEAKAPAAEVAAPVVAKKEEKKVSKEITQPVVDDTNAIPEPKEVKSADAADIATAEQRNSLPCSFDDDASTYLCRCVLLTNNRGCR